MSWIAPSEKDTAAATLEKRLWDSADQFRANGASTRQPRAWPWAGESCAFGAEMGGCQ